MVSGPLFVIKKRHSKPKIVDLYDLIAHVRKSSFQFSYLCRRVSYTTSFNWKPSEEPSYIDKKLLEQEKQEASEGLSVLQYNARSVNATDRDKEAYDNALNKVLFTSEQIENINSGQAYQTKEGGPTYSSSTMSQQKEHLSRLEGMVNNAGNDGSNTNEYRAWINEQIHNMQSGKEYKMEKGSDDTFKGLFVPFDVPR